MAILWYNYGMKTAISISDALFEEADAFARQRGLSRSELYARAVAEYLAKHRDTDVTARLNAVYALEESSLDGAVGRAQGESVRDDEW